MTSKKCMLASFALCLSVTVFSQTDTTRKDTSGTKRDSTQKRDTAVQYNQNERSLISGGTQHSDVSGANRPVSGTTQSNNGSNSNGNQNNNSNAAASATWPNNGSANTSATNQSSTSASATTNIPKPNFGRYYIPVLGSYSPSQGAVDITSVTITPDENNAGKIWIEGLTEARLFALLKSNGIYKIPSQKQDKHTVSEGTLTYDENTKQVNICVGCGYNENNIASENETKLNDGKSKSRKSVIRFSGTKKEQGTAKN